MSSQNKHINKLQAGIPTKIAELKKKLDAQLKVTINTEVNKFKEEIKKDIANLKEELLVVETTKQVFVPKIKKGDRFRLVSEKDTIRTAKEDSYLSDGREVVDIIYDGSKYPMNGITVNGFVVDNSSPTTPKFVPKFKKGDLIAPAGSPDEHGRVCEKDSYMYHEKEVVDITYVNSDGVLMTRTSALPVSHFVPFVKKFTPKFKVGDVLTINIDKTTYVRTALKDSYLVNAEEFVDVMYEDTQKIGTRLNVDQYKLKSSSPHFKQGDYIEYKEGANVLVGKVTQDSFIDGEFEVVATTFWPAKVQARFCKKLVVAK